MQLEAGSLWQHQKHDPELGEFHQYRLIRWTEGVRDPNGHGVSKFTKKVFPVRDADTLRLLWICCDRDLAWAYDPELKKWLATDMVVYRNLLADELPWARPFGEFLDGRFKPIQSDAIDEPTMAMELFG